MRAVLALAAGGLLVACGGETAIVLEIHKAPGVSSEVKALRIFAGVGHDADLVDPAWWVAADLAEEESRVALADEMGASTYRYLVKPGGGLDEGGTELMFAVAGYKNESDEKPVVFGHSAAAVRFGEGEVRVYDFPLVTFEDARHGVHDTGCVWWDDEGQRIKRDAIAPRDDGDCDAYSQDTDEVTDCVLDCADDDPDRHPGATEICADGVDQNCCEDNDGRDDLDGDGFAVCGTANPDCVDLAPGTTGPIDVFGNEVPSNQIHPEAEEVCDGIDNDCAGGCDDGEGFDPDGDGYLNCRDRNGTDELAGVHRLGDSCDSSPLDCLESARPGGPPPETVHPGALDDSCDNWDQNCDGACDEIIVAAGDQDGDGFPACAEQEGWIGLDTPQCARVPGGDCGGDDSELEFPGRSERCDGIDFNCDLNQFPALSPCFVVDENVCRLGRRSCNDTPGSVNPGFGACMHETGGPGASLPMAWCQLSCPQPVDPIQCLVNPGTACIVGFPDATAPMPCAPPALEIPLPMDGGVTGCNYFLVGGTSQGDWQVTLVDPANQTGFMVSGCGSRMRVLGALPDADDRTVLVMTGVAPHLIQLQRADACVAGGPTCTFASP
jgi:hypothetical protein